MKLVHVAMILFLLSKLGCGNVDSALAQTMSVTATLTDSDGTVWVNGSCSISSYNSTTQPSQYQGTTIPQYPSCSINGSGVLSATLYNTSTLFPSSAAYQFNICSNTSAACSSFITPITAANATALLSGLITAPRFAAGYGSRGYVDIEVANPVSGSYYYNVTDTELRLFNGTSWTAIGGNGGGATIPSTTNLIAGDGTGNGANSGIAPANVATLSGPQTFTGAKQLNGDATGTPSFWNFVTSTNSGSTTGITAGLACSIQHVFVSGTNYTAWAFCNNSSVAAFIYRSGLHALGAESYTSQINYDSAGDIVTAGTVTGTRAIVGQITPTGSTPTVAIGAACGGCATPTITGTNISGTISVATLTSNTTGVLFTVTFNGTLAAAPKVCHLQPQNAAGVFNNTVIFTDPPTTTTWVAEAAGATADSVTMQWGYICL